MTRPRKRQAADPIGAALRGLYDSVANEPLPANLLDLIAEIDAKIGKVSE